MQTIIYNLTGSINMTTSETGLGTISAIEAEIPDGYYVESVNPETGEPVLKENPKTEEQKKIEALEAKVQALSGTQEFQEECIAEMAGVVYAE